MHDQRARSYTVLVEGLVQKRPGVFSVVCVVDLGVHGKAAEDVHDGIGVEELPFVTCVPEIGDIPRPHLIGARCFEAGRLVTLYALAYAVASRVESRVFHHAVDCRDRTVVLALVEQGPEGLRVTQVDNVGARQTLDQSLSLFLGQSVARLEVGAILPTVLEFLALSNLLASVAEGTVGQPKALTCLRQRSAVVHSFRDQLVGFAAILVTDQFSLSPQIACAFFLSPRLLSAPGKTF